MYHKKSSYRECILSLKKFGTGVKKIKKAYKNALEQPKLCFTNHTIQVILPKLFDIKELSIHEKHVYQLIKLYKELSRID